MYATFASQLRWNEFEPWVAVLNRAYNPRKPIGSGFSGRPLFDRSGLPLAFEHSLKGSIKTHGILNPVCVFDVDGLLYPVYGASRINAARALELETGEQVAIPAIVSGPGPRPPILAGSESIDLEDEGAREFLRHFKTAPPSFWEVLPSGHLYFYGCATPQPLYGVK